MSQPNMNDIMAQAQRMQKQLQEEIGRAHV